jgi:ATP/maltotriose-dependent transcriptional regulator MalT
LSLSGHPDPARFAAEFSGSERTVAEYLLAEVLDRQSEPVRRLLLRTSVLERVSGDLADAMTGGRGGEGMLQELEEANAFVVALDTARSWFRYHHLFADLLGPRTRQGWYSRQSSRTAARYSHVRAAAVTGRHPHNQTATTELVYRHQIVPALTRGAEVMDQIFG